MDQGFEDYLQTLYKNNKMDIDTRERIERSVAQFVRLLKQINFRDVGIIPVYYQYFGSFLNGFGTKSSDVDFTILTDSYVDERTMLQFLKQELDAINKRKSNQRFEIKRTVFTARIPVINIKDVVENVDYDLCCNNILGVVNTKLLAAYSKLSPKVEMGGILIKVWGKAQDVITQQRFSSYAIILMWITYLQRMHQLPNLQDKQYLNAKGSAESKLVIARKTNYESKEPDDKFTTNVRFMQEKEEIQKRMADCTIDQYSCAELLIGFWNYYIRGGKFESDGKLISIHELQPKAIRQGMFQISDPFDIPHDPGQRVNKLPIDVLSTIREKFEMAAIAMSRNINIDNLFNKQ